MPASKADDRVHVASPKDANQIAKLHLLAYDGLERAWSEAEFLSLLKQERCRTWFIERDGYPVSMLMVMHLPNVMEILTIATAPRYRKLGLAQKLHHVLEEFSIQKHCSKIWLEVAQDNRIAVLCYQSWGYQKQGLRPNYYPRENTQACDAILYEKQIVK